ncbi:ABC transporter ATP-binding protein [Streptomyces himalayensis]|uniref:ABC transporter ATP-binding protein n=1 Tax=Streptomyces himalayensis subsp. himalayensis TaxID=2756131 RepID=A0A7W0DK15_9ACTN|nr:ABC transporter ATP-binding protein [Streptomyces himalayensis]MBA2946529.1 ABC transporter ATP-binding protein [Streptomyces himalayensis subsp. himalayensis]
MIEIKGVSHRFGRTRALDDVSLDIGEGEFCALLGPSGCGKTTLLRILAGFETPDVGAVTLDREDLLSVPPHRRPVNLMFQSFALFPHMSVERNVAYGLERERLPRAAIRERVDAVLATVGLTAYARRKPHELSGGQRQRVALARAIVKRPRLLLLDEPLSALDKQVRAEMQLELKRLQHEVGITFLVVTHDQEEAMSLADRIAVMNAGRIEQTDAPVTLYERPRTTFVAGFVGANNLFPGPNGITAVRPERIRIRNRIGGGKGGNDNDGTVEGEGERLTGTVVDVSFHGGTSHLAVRVPGLDRPVLIAVQGPSRVTSGEQVSLSWPPDAAVHIPASIPASTPVSTPASPIEGEEP